MPKRLAITIAGAVSLGSYEAGVLYEIVRAIGEHNAHPDTTSHPEEAIEIDVLTGASAGGMTAVIATQKLLYEAQSLFAADNNPFYNAWVVDISLEGLLNFTSGEASKAAYSIFSSDLIENLSRKYITARYASGQGVGRSRHPAASEMIRLGLALSNLNGVAYSYPLRARQGYGNETFGYGRFQDEMVGAFTADNSDGNDAGTAWEPWRNAAVSCGAFPFAFRVKELRRLETEYTRHNRDPWPPPPERDFAYTDGGIFQNEPLGLAKNLVDLIDRPQRGTFQDADSRFYLYVAPGAKTSDVNQKFSAAIATFLPTTQALVGAILHQAKFQDWINAEEINAQIDNFNTRAEELYRALLYKEVQPAVLQQAADVLLPGLFHTKPPPAPGVRDDTVDDARARLRKQFNKESKTLSDADPTAEKAWIDSILVLETAAELNLRDEMNIYGITASNKELAGGGLFAFEGFFALILRQHDYNLGRQKAREFLAAHRQPAPQRVAGSPVPPPDIAPIRYDPTDQVPSIKVPPRDPQTGDVLVSQLDEDIRQKLYQTVSKRADELLIELNIPWYLRGPIRMFYVNRELKKRLAL